MSKSKTETLYKLTDADGYTRRAYPNKVLWTPGKPVTVTFAGKLCAPGCLHASRTPLVAVFHDGVAGRYLPGGRLWEARGVVKRSDGLKVGCARLTTVREIEIPSLLPAVRVRAAIYCVREHCESTLAWQTWAARWLSGEDRFEAAAATAEESAAARGAAGAAEAAAGRRCGGRGRRCGGRGRRRRHSGRGRHGGRRWRRRRGRRRRQRRGRRSGRRRRRGRRRRWGGTRLSISMRSSDGRSRTKRSCLSRPSMPDRNEIARETFRTLVECDIPVILLGEPGIGKTTAVRELAAKIGGPLCEIIPAIREPADFGGYPVPDGSTVKLLPVGSWVAFAEEVKRAGRGTLFLDEVPCATVAIQNALLRVVLDRVVGDFALPAGVHIICAGNMPDQSVGGWELSAAFANRLAHIAWPTPTVAEWITWLFAQLGASEDAAYARHLVAAFLSAKPELLLALPPDDADRSRAWPSPRSWAACTRALTRVVTLHRGKTGFAEYASAAAQATVGKAAAACFGDVLRGMELIDPEELLANPTLWDTRVVSSCASLEGEGSSLVRAWAALVAVCAAVLSSKLDNGRVSKKRWFAAWEIHKRARLSTIADGAVSGAAVAALAIPLGVAALPAKDLRPVGVAHGLPMPEEALEALKVRAVATA